MNYAKARELQNILPELRRQTARVLSKETVKGERINVEARDGETIATWFHRAAGTAAAPVVFELHGGGFALGDARKGDALREWVKDCYGVNVVGIDYRLAPEHPWPTALHDVADALRAYADMLGARATDSREFYLMGFSAGANLAVAVSLALQDEGIPKSFEIKGLILHYPFLDAETDPHVKEEIREDLPADLAEAFNVWYTDGADPRNPLVSPLYASSTQLRNLPPTHTYAVAGDGCLAEAETFHARMRASGGDERLVVVQGVYHGYIEDAANVQLYEATTFPETREARPHDFVERAEESVEAGLTGFLGEPKRTDSFERFFVKEVR